MPPRYPTGQGLTPLPEILPIFPLPGVLLLPRGRLPLNIFEPRYLAMMDDAIKGERMIGMVQPLDPRTSESEPAVYRTGCAGRITAFTEVPDGRYQITLTGICRFRIADELPLLRGYRRIQPDWMPFRGDLEAEAETDIDRERLTEALSVYFRTKGIQADWDMIRKAASEHLVTTIAMMCPFGPSEKQALLEGPDLSARTAVMIALLEMAARGSDDDGATRQ